MIGKQYFPFGYQPNNTAEVFRRLLVAALHTKYRLHTKSGKFLQRFSLWAKRVSYLESRFNSAINFSKLFVAWYSFLPGSELNSSIGLLDNKIRLSRGNPEFFMN